jgi:hypothetical protein
VPAFKVWSLLCMGDGKSFDGYAGQQSVTRLSPAFLKRIL